MEEKEQMRENADMQDDKKSAAEQTLPEGNEASVKEAGALAPDLRYKDAKEVGKGGLLGFFIGLAVIVPGVSGSTVAIIFKLYDKLYTPSATFSENSENVFAFCCPSRSALPSGSWQGSLRCKSSSISCRSWSSGCSRG